MNNNKRRSAIILGVVVLLLSACGTSQPTRYYLLSSLTDTDVDAARRSGLTLGVGPIQLPEYLDRYQIVSRQTDHELHVAVLEQWAEPLGDNLARVLRENLGILLSTDAVFGFPWKFATDIDYQVAVTFSRFERNPQNELVLHARWEIIADRNPLLVQKTTIHEPLQAADYTAHVAAASQALAQLSREIAGAIQRIEAGSR